MPAITCYTDPLRPGIAQMPVYVVGDDQSWQLQFNDGKQGYNPGNVMVSIGYIKGLPDGTYNNAFRWVDRLNNRHQGSLALASGIPGLITWDESPIGVLGANGAYLLKGRKTAAGAVSPGGSIRKVYVKYPGAPVSTAPAIRFQGGSTITGRGAKLGAATLSTGAITAIVIADGGYGYTLANAPEIIITDSAGSGARVYVSAVTDGVITQLTVAEGGSSYSSPTSTFRDPEATATATVAGSSGVTGATVTNPGYGYTTAPSIAFDSGVAAATATLLLSSWGLSGLTITNAGAGYFVAPAVSFSGGTGSGAAAIAVISPAGAVGSIQITNPGFYNITGSGFITGTLSGGGGSGATIAVFYSNDSGSTQITQIQVLNGGSGYTGAPTVNFVLNGTVTQITAATATATVTTGEVIQIILTNPGTGYGATAPTVSLTAAPSGGTNATATAQLTGSPISSVITVGTAGSGYTAPPNMTFSGGNGTGAAATALIAIGITAIAMTQTGYAYTGLPDVKTYPDNGAVLIPCGVLCHANPFLEDFSPAVAQPAITVTPYTTGEQDNSGNLVYNDSLLIVRPRYVIQPSFVLQSDGLTWAAAFTPVNAFVNALLAFQSAVVLDFEVFGAGRLLLKSKLQVLAG